MHNYIIGNETSAALELEAPPYILPEEIFKIKCRASEQFRIQVFHGTVIRKFPPQACGAGKICQTLYVAHVKKACKVVCFSGAETKTEIITVIGKQKVAIGFNDT